MDYLDLVSLYVSLDSMSAQNLFSIPLFSIVYYFFGVKLCLVADLQDQLLLLWELGWF